MEMFNTHTCYSLLSLCVFRLLTLPPLLFCFPLALRSGETALLIDDKMSGAANRQRVATVVAHELAHQWFGNLVTFDWWTDLVGSVLL